MRFVMRTETVEEFLKRGGKVIKLEKELNTINGAYKTYSATSRATKEGRWTQGNHFNSTPLLKIK